MKSYYKSAVGALVVITIALASTPVYSGKGPGNGGAGGGRDALDFNEETHLVFMREEEKLARDVYIAMGTLYPRSRVFGKIDEMVATSQAA